MPVFQIAILILSAIIHEYMHGWVADRMGDSTARRAGRLTLNPLAHIDPLGSVILPGLMLLTNAGFIFGWAKPVPFNPAALRDQRWGSAKVAAAGPLTNLAIAAIFAVFLRLPLGFSAAFSSLVAVIVYVNLLLFVFNIMPVPPLDGSKILASFLPWEWQRRLYAVEAYGLILLLLFVSFGYFIFIPIVNWLFYLLVG